MKHVIIYITASYYNEEKRGTFSVRMEHNGKSKSFSGVRYNSTSNRLVIEGMIDGVERLKEPCMVEFVVATNIGILNLVKCKGPHKDLMKILNQMLAAKQCTYTITVTDKGAAWLRRSILYANPDYI